MTTEPTTPDPEWIKVGGDVAEFQGDRCMVGKIARITATQIILERGSRYRRSTRVEVGEGRYGKLRPLTDPNVQQARARKAVSEAFAEIDQLQRQVWWVRQPKSTEPADMLDQLAAVIETARARVTAAHAGSPQESENDHNGQ